MKIFINNILILFLLKLYLFKDKYNEAIKHCGTICTITPDWVVDSVNKNILQDVSLYNTQNVILPEVKGLKIF